MSKGDATGYTRGAKGIDGTKDVGFQNKGVSKSNQAGMFGRSWFQSNDKPSYGLNDITGESY